MRTIEVSDEVYERLSQLASNGGVSVETFLAGLIAEPVEIGSLFTSEFISDQHRIADEMSRGSERFSLEELQADLESHKAARKAATP